MRPDGELVTFAREHLLRRIKAAEKRVWLASPFISASIAARVCEATEESTAAQKRLLTALDARSVQCGVLDPDALSKLQSVGFVIASIANLHAKVSLVDSAWGMVGSGNLTGAGLGDEEGGGNHEMGVLLTPSQIERATEIFATWWTKAESVSAEEIARYAALPKLPKNRIGNLGPMLETPRTAALNEILAEDAVAANARRYWINSNYHDPDNETWWRRNWVSDGNKKSYETGDLLAIYLGKTNGGPQRCPAVLRVAAPCENNPEFVLKERDVEAADRWPFVTKTSLVADVPAWSGVQLAVAGKTYLQVENGCELTRKEFEKVAQAMLG